MRARQPFLLALLALAPAAQTPAVLAREGDPVLGVGRLRSFDQVAILESGPWLAEVNTDHPSNARDDVVVRRGIPILREDDPVASPPGATVREFLAWDVDPAGNLLWQLVLEGPGIEPGNRAGIYWNTRPLARQGELVGALELEPDAVWAAFRAARFLGADAALIVGEVHRPGETTTRDVLAALFLDGFGRVTATEIRAATGWTLPALDTAIRAIPSTPANLGTSGRGDFVWLVKGFGPPSTDGVLLLGTERVVAREGDPAPVVGRVYASFERTEADVDRFGGVAFTCNLDGTTPELVDTGYLLVARGEKLVQEGDVLPSLGAPLGNQQETPVQLADSGDVFWSARLRETHPAEDRAYMRNREVIAREGRTRVGGRLVLSLKGDHDAFDTSPEGRFFLGRAELEGVGEALFLVDFGAVVPVHGCTPHRASLRRLAGDPLPGGTLRLGLDGAQAIGDLPWLLVSPGALEGCGVRTPFGELLLGAPPVLGVLGPPWTGIAARLDLNLPPRTEWVESVWTLQGFFRSATPDGSRWTATNALRIRIGAP